MKKSLGVISGIALSSVVVSGCSKDTLDSDSNDLREDINNCLIDISEIEGRQEPIIDEGANFDNFFVWIKPKLIFEGIESCGCTVTNVNGKITPIDGEIDSMDVYYLESGMIGGRSFSSNYSPIDLGLLFSEDLPASGQIVLDHEFTVNLGGAGNDCSFLNSEGELVDSFTVERDYVFESPIR